MLKSLTYAVLVDVQSHIASIDCYAAFELLHPVPDAVTHLITVLANTAVSAHGKLQTVIGCGNVSCGFCHTPELCLSGCKAAQLLQVFCSSTIFNGDL